MGLIRWVLGLSEIAPSWSLEAGFTQPTVHLIAKLSKCLDSDLPHGVPVDCHGSEYVQLLPQRPLHQVLGQVGQARHLPQQLKDRLSRLDGVRLPTQLADQLEQPIPYPVVRLLRQLEFDLSKWTILTLDSGPLWILYWP